MKKQYINIDCGKGIILFFESTSEGKMEAIFQRIHIGREYTSEEYIDEVEDYNKLLKAIVKKFDVKIISHSIEDVYEDGVIDFIWSIEMKYEDVVELSQIKSNILQ